jgi:hypothetical protein
VRSLVVAWLAAGLVPACAEPRGDADTMVDPLPWGLTDVSVLFPTDDAAIPNLLGAVNDRDGAPVVLLDEAVFGLLGTDVLYLTESANRDQHYPYLRVTALRLDPCVDSFDPHAVACVRAIRLVVQPIWPIEGGDSYDIYDASLHLFYALSEAEWSELLARYNAIRTADLSALPLTVHPVLADGLDSELARGLASMIVDFATADRMVRMTFMATGRSGNNWFWGGFDRGRDGTFAPIMLPGGGTEDGFTQFGRDSTLGVPEMIAFPTALLRNPTLDAMSASEVEAGLTRLYELENPLRSNATNVRCADCHLAEETKQHVLARRSLAELDVAERYHADDLGLDLGVVRTIENHGFNMHGFSYFQGEPAISQRVVHDSAEVVRFLRERP